MRTANRDGRPVPLDPVRPDAPAGIDDAIAGDGRFSPEPRLIHGRWAECAIVDLRPGVLLFTGAPAGVGVGQEPPRLLRPGDELRTWYEGIGELTHRFVGADRTPVRG